MVYSYHAKFGYHEIIHSDQTFELPVEIANANNSYNFVAMLLLSKKKNSNRIISIIEYRYRFSINGFHATDQF